MAANGRRRMVVEEVGGNATDAIEEIKEKVQELEEVAQDLNEDVAKTEEIQEGIEEAVQSVTETAENAGDHESREEEQISHVHDDIHASPHEHVEHHSEHMEEEVGPEVFQNPPGNSGDQDMLEIKDPTGTNPLVVIVPGIFLLGALLGGIYFYQKGTGIIAQETPTPTQTETVTATPQNSATPSAAVDLSKYPINVQNGSGTPGEAGKVKTILEGGGFKVSATGNAASYNFTKTVIKVKSDVPAAFVSQLTALLGKTYSLDTNQTLPASSADSVQVVVGSSKAK